MHHSKENSREKPMPYAIFSVADQFFGLSALYVREIFVIPNVTSVPNREAHIRGLINLRGKIVVLIDFRQYIGLQPHSDAFPNNPTSKEMVIVCDLGYGLCAFTVDEVVAIETIIESHIESSETSNVQERFLLKGNIARREKSGNIVVLLEPEALTEAFFQSTEKAS